MGWSVISELLWKNYKVFRVHQRKYLTIYISPLLILLLLMVLQAWTVSNFTWENADPPERQLPPIPRCNGDECLTLGVVYQGEKQPYMSAVVEYLRKANNWSEGDIKELDVGIGGVLDHLRSHPNKTQSVVVFCGEGGWKVGQLEIPCQADHYHLNTYTIIYNLSLFHQVPYMSGIQKQYQKDPVTLKLKYDIDRAILEHHAPSTRFQLSFVDFPNRTSRFVQGISLVANYGSFFFIIPYLALLVMEGGRLLVQKEKRLRVGLNIVGVSHLQFYCAQLLSYLFHVVVISLMFCIFGWLLDFKFYSKGLLFFDLLVLTVNGMVLGLLAFCITAAVTERGLGMSILYGFVLYSIVMQWLFTGGILFDMLYFNNVSTTVILLRYLFNAYPSFHFSKIFSDVTRKADSHIDTFENRYVEGTEFTWDDLWTRQSKSFEKPYPQSYTLPSTAESTFYMLLTSITFLIGLWLLDTLVESNRGSSQSLVPCKKRQRKSSSYIVASQDDYLVNITNLQKTYNNKNNALKGVTANLKRGEIVGLLGQNGAGKSTFINILIGAIAKTRGEAMIDGIQVEQDIIAIRKLIGVCPQFDILWEQLTAGEHVQLFHKLKGLSIDRESTLRFLEVVSLEKNIDGPVRTFSGGMRRRLSLALSLVGNPKLLILDEPSTGMDAKIRLNTWKLILSLREKHTVLITTHNMEEAECVSDRIMIMSKGKIVAEGTAPQLKKQYGQGYVIRGTDRATRQEVNINCKASQLEKTLAQIQERQLENWSLQETTLEQVFLNVSNRF